MDFFYKKTILSIVFSLTLFFSSYSFAVQIIDLYHHPHFLLTANAIHSRELSRVTDAEGFTHIRMQQIVDGYPVWGGNYVIHVAPNGVPSNKTINGTIYKNMVKDLLNTPSFVFTEAQKQNVLNNIIKLHHAHETFTKPPRAELMVYIDKNHLAHWVYYLTFTEENKIPSYLVDAITAEPYQQWDALNHFDSVKAGGYGGNSRTGRQLYDGQPSHLNILMVERDPFLKLCYMRNDAAVIKHYYRQFEDMQFNCEATNYDHLGLYWNGSFDSVRGDYSPSNNTLYAATVTNNMFQSWFGMPVWKDKDGKSKRIIYFVHDETFGASFRDDGYIIVGDSLTYSSGYPATTIDLIAHEIGHAVTYQASGLNYSGESGAVNEAFSDMTGKTAEFYAHGVIDNWNIGAVFENKDQWLRYMDQPTKDCADKKPNADCSIDNYKNYQERLAESYASGIFNRAFYLLATMPEWDIKSAYRVMLYANLYYWTNTSNFCQAARGVMLAAKELNKNADDVVDAFDRVGINVEHCE